MTAHNTRPTYELQKNCGAGSGFAMKLGPASFGRANLPIGNSLTKGRYVVTALVKSANAHGPGGRIELEATQAKASEVLAGKGRRLRCVNHVCGDTTPLMPTVRSDIERSE